MRLTAQLSGRLSAMLVSLDNPDFSELMRAAEVVIHDDHVHAVLEGRGGDGAPLKPTTYRGSTVAKPRRKRQSLATVRGGIQPYQAGSDAMNGNLTTSEYRKLAGPPLAPRGVSSRVVRNFVTRSGLRSDGTWFAEGTVIDMEDRKGRPFLHFHFDGAGRLPKRDLRGLRAETLAKLLRLLELDVRRKFAEG